jgi:hypothetical protein
MTERVVLRRPFESAGSLRRTCGDLLVCFSFSHTRLRVHRTPGLPCALYFSRDKVDAQLGRKTCRGIVELCASVITRESGRSSIPETLVINREAAAYWIPRLRGV